MNSKSCILTIIKNEHLYLDEWIRYHINFGIEHFFIIEDIDSNSHKDITDKYGDRITLIDIESFYEKHIYDYIVRLKRNTNVNIAQGILLPTTLEIIAREYSDKYDWCFVIDDDEFLTFEDDTKSLDRMLSLFNDYDAFVIQWESYGANGLVFMPDYNVKGVVDTYTKKLDIQTIDAKSSLLKSCYNLKRYNKKYYRNCHRPQFCKCVNTDFSNKILVPTYKNIYIRHYITRSLEEYMWKQDVRGYFHRKPTYDFFFRMNPDMKDKRDEYIQAVKDKHPEIYSNTEEN